MALMFGYLSNDFSLVPSAFAQIGEVLHPTGVGEKLDWGMGYVENQHRLLRKRLGQPSEDFDFAHLVGDLRSQCIMGVALPPTAARSGADIPPYRFRRWLMARAGEVPDISAYRDRLIAELPDYVASGIRGKHPGEVLLHFVMERVRRASDRANLTLAPQRSAWTLAESIDAVRQLARKAGVEKPPVQNYLLTNGSIMVASCAGAPMHYTLIEGIYDDPIRRAEPLFAGHRPKRVDHPTFRAAFFVHGLRGKHDVWHPMDDQTVAYVDRHHTIVLESIDAVLVSAE